MPRTVLLDTNIWAFVVDEDAAADLRRIARAGDLEILISPAVVFEQLRVKDSGLRKRLLEVTTRGWWTRLMPEAYLECSELVEAIRKRRPTWLVKSAPRASMATYQRNRSDWRHGFWRRARTSPEWQASINAELGQTAVDETRRDVRNKRTDAVTQRRTLETLDLAGWQEWTCEVALGRSQVTTQWWRVGAANYFAQQLSMGGSSSSTYHDWLDPFLDLRAVAKVNEWLSFWLEVDSTELPTQWLSWAVQSLRLI